MKASINWLIISAMAVVASVILQIGACFFSEELFILFFYLAVILFCFGTVTMIFMAVRIKRLLIIRKVIKFGVPGIGYFEGGQSRSSFFVGFTILFSYRDENGVPHITKTLRGLSEEQIKHLKKMGEFKIRFYQKHAVIEEDLRGITQASFSRAAVGTGSSYAPQTRRTVQTPPVERCSYCGIKLPASAVKCPSCTGPV